MHGVEFDLHFADYPQAIAACGGLPVELARDADVEGVIERLDGLVLTGGADVDPANYGEAPDPKLAAIEPDRDAWELALLAAAEARGLPVLCVCRGAQLLNVARGGTLRQHVDEDEGDGHPRFASAGRDVAPDRPRGQPPADPRRRGEVEEPAHDGARSACHSDEEDRHVRTSDRCRIPSHAASTPTPAVPRTGATATPTCPRWLVTMAALTSDEYVVKPPSKPVAKKRRSSTRVGRGSRTRATTAPSAAAPATLRHASVRGEPVSAAGCHRSSRSRASVPSAPPTKTTRAWGSVARAGWAASGP